MTGIPGSSARAQGLAWLLAPTAPTAFLNDYWERAPLTIRRDQPDHYGDLLSLDDIDTVLTSGILRVDDVQMTNAAQAPSPQDYSHPGGIIDVARLYQQFGDGSTVILPQLHFRLPRLAALCRALEHEFSARFQTNVYLTPGGAQGFKRHYDSHDVFVLQIAGRKHWRLYDTPIALPLRGQAFRPDTVEAGAQTAAFTLEPGDVAYVPRGMMHDAESDDAMSLHITVGIMTRTWHDLFIEAMSGVSLADPAFRRSLPAGFARSGFDRTPARNEFAALLRSMADRIDIDAALGRFAEEFVATRHPLLAGQLGQIAALPRVNTASLITARPDLVYQLERTDDGFTINCFGSAITLPAHAEAPTLAALEADNLAIHDLPGDLDDAGRLVLIRRLVREGLVMVKD